MPRTPRAFRTIPLRIDRAFFHMNLTLTQIVMDFDLGLI